MRYRPDVDGLRAFAIVAVILFHIGFKAFPGGFIGVDVFFVISGFLITGLITDSLRRGEFSFSEFYARRTRRIFPALFVMLPVVLVAGYFVMTPGEYEAMGRSALYSSAFLANIYFLLHTGYFDPLADTMPLLHLWSIGVEEQFYLIWPISVFLVWRFLKLERAATMIALTVVTILLALLCIVWTAHDAKAAFFLPFTRLWEFTLGALLLALPAIRYPRVADGVSVLGLVAMLVAVFAFSAKLDYPGYYAILPCLGTAAVIAAGQKSIVGRLLSLGPNVLLGKISYSLYLWHWPIIIFYCYYVGRTPTVGEGLALILISVLVALLSWRFIELPVRRRRDRPRLHIAYGAGVAASVAGLALIITANAGFSGRLPKGLRSLASEREMTGSRCSQRIPIPELDKRRGVCVVGAPWGSGKGVAVLWGDSHAAHLAPLVDIAAQRQGLSVIVWKGCAPYIDDVTILRNRRDAAAAFKWKCGKARRTILDYVKANPDVKMVIISNAWPNYPGNVYEVDGLAGKLDKEQALLLIEAGFSSTMAEMAGFKRPVLLMGDVPHPNFSVPACVVQATLKLWRKPCEEDMNYVDRDRVFRYHQPTESILAGLASDKHRIYYVNVQKLMCGEKGCPLSMNGEVIYADGNHLRRDLSRDTKEKLVSVLRLDEALRMATETPSSAARAEAR